MKPDNGHYSYCHIIFRSQNRFHSLLDEVKKYYDVQYGTLGNLAQDIGGKYMDHKGGKYSWMLSGKTADQMILTLNTMPVCDSEQILSDIGWQESLP